MARDSSPARGTSDRPVPARRGGFLTGLLVGVLLGIGMALAVAVWLNVHGSPFSEREAAVELPPIKQPSETPRSPGGSVEGSGSSGSALPGDGVGGPELRDSAPASAPASESPPAPRAGSAGGLYLQAGAFRNALEADDRKLSLSLLGQAAVVQRVVGSGGPLYRVRLGPFADPTELDRTRELLRENGIDSIPVRLDPNIP